MRWHAYHMGIAQHAARQSKDTTQVGAALVDGGGKIALLPAYNGPPAGVKDHPDRFVRPRKYLFASHAEANLIAFAARRGIRTEGCWVYVTHHPCDACARLLIQSGIVRVITGDGTTSMEPERFTAAATMFAEACVEVVRLIPTDAEE